MERLTDKNRNAINRCGEYSSCYSCHRTKCYINELCDKLGQLEDVMEKFGIESVEELEKIIHCNTTNALIEAENKSMLELQNKQLQHKLAVKDKALELACEPRDDWGGREYSGTEYDDLLKNSNNKSNLRYAIYSKNDWEDLKELLLQCYKHKANLCWY